MCGRFVTRWPASKWLVLVLLLPLGGCAATFSSERDSAAYGVWAKRGQTLGDLAHLYCEQGAERESEMMAWAIRRYSYPASVQIDCDLYKKGNPHEHW